MSQNKMSQNKIPEKEIMLENLSKIAYTLDKTYLKKLTKDYLPLSFDQVLNPQDQLSYLSNIRAVEITRWVYDKNQMISDCFNNILSLFADGDHSLALVVKKTTSATKMYFVVKNYGSERNEESRNNIDLLQNALAGNFPGTEATPLTPKELETMLHFQKENSVSVLVNTPSDKSENHISQGLDKLLNGVVPKSKEEEYTVMFLMESLPEDNVKDILAGYEDMATAMEPHMSYQFQQGVNQTDTEGEMSSLSHGTTVGDSITKTHSINIGGFVGVGGEKTPKVGGSLGLGYSKGKTKSNSVSDTETKSRNNSISNGTNESNTYTYKSHLVANLLQKLEKTMEKIHSSEGNGLWKYATYVLANNGQVSKNVADFLRSITQGEESYLESATIQEWSRTVRGDEQDKIFPELCKYISHVTHPLFATSASEEDENLLIVTPTSYVGTNELSKVVSFPQKSLQGLPVLDCVQFGREPHGLQPLQLDLRLGCAYHMYQKVEHQEVNLSLDELTKHTFITGSTGSGKSNTIYTLLDKIAQKGKPFLVIEPTKGEYKHVFATDKNMEVSVYGTNPDVTPLLRINPFKFHPKIHITEHLESLVDIFNVCWPMYAAMPAVLKAAISRAYEQAGWNLQTSKNAIHESIFPTFDDVISQISQVLEESAYSKDNKGDYIGALSTRLSSLTNGTYAMIFTQNDLSDHELFEKNVIVDLSRLKSSETKSLIMGLLVMKLSQYYMVSEKENATLSHVTVLEEAHHLLKRTSTEQNAESSNLVGKSVEMLSNAIAEMRTYGEGFIIADQSPNILDMSAIRNTNTKIIMKLPEESDRNLVGKSANLSDDQIEELSRLKTGVAAVYQNNWLEPVLCHIDPFVQAEKQRRYLPPVEINETKDMKAILAALYFDHKVEQGMTLPEDFFQSNLSTSLKRAVLAIKNGTTDLNPFIYHLVDGEKFFSKQSKDDTMDHLLTSFQDYLPPSIQLEEQMRQQWMHILIKEESLKNRQYELVLTRFETRFGIKERGV